MATAVALSHNVFDGGLFLGVCDKIVPGLLIGALSFGHLPALFVPAGPMTSGISNSAKAKTRQLFAEGKVDFQTKRNNRLNQEIALLQEELKEIKELEETKNNLLARMEIIQQLQGQRPQIVHTFHEIATRLPDGIFLTAMKQIGENQLVLEGRAESNARVSALMRRMDRSDYFKIPKLDVIESDKDDSISTFKLSLVQDRPKNEGEFEDGI